MTFALEISQYFQLQFSFLVIPKLDLKKMSGSFHFSYFGQSDPKRKNISCPVCLFSVKKIRILSENDG